MMDSQAGFTQSVEAGGPDHAVGFRFSVTWVCLLTPVAEKEAQTGTLPDPVSPRRIQVGNGGLRATGGNGLLFNLYLSRSGGGQLLLGAALLGALVIPIWHALPTRSKPKTVAIETNALGGGWLRQSASNADAGAKQARQLLLYQPSRNATNGQLDFTWRVGERGVGWIFRAKDVSNYYAMRIKILRREPALALSLEHFSVQLGEEGSHSEKVLVLTGNAPTLRLKLDVAGPSFTLYLQGNAVDYWTDTRLTAGAFGFYEERGEAADVLGVRMSFSRWAHARPSGHPNFNRDSAANLFSAIFENTLVASGGA